MVAPTMASVSSARGGCCCCRAPAGGSALSETATRISKTLRIERGVGVCGLSIEL
jgi:hypothetical protein